MRLLTGSGIAGLRGIHPIRDDGLHPRRCSTSHARRSKHICATAASRPRFDRSNDDPRFLRNRVRVLVRELGATDNLAAVAAQARAQWPLLERAIDEVERTCADVSDPRDTLRVVAPRRLAALRAPPAPHSKTRPRGAGLRRPPHRERARVDSQNEHHQNAGARATRPNARAAQTSRRDTAVRDRVERRRAGLHPGNRQDDAPRKTPQRTSNQ
jgi:tRNA(Ile)-lysidine synthase TilS/MesJ